MANPTVLLTGFEAFDGQETNASWLAVEAVDERRLSPRGRLVRAQLPCVFGGALDALRAEIRGCSPELVVCVGQAGGRHGLTLERVAINVDDARIPDNAGAQPIDVPITPNGPVGYWSSLPIKAIVAALHERDLPASVSQTAGTFVCNHVFYGLMHSLEGRPGTRGGFIHVPFLPEQTTGKQKGAPSLALADQALGLEVAITTALSHKKDRRIAGGATH